MARRIVAIVGSYRKGGTVDRVVDEILSAARERGADVARIDLCDRRIEFCTNCRDCTQQEGEQRGVCTLADDMASVLDEIQQADALVLGAPINFGTVTAVMKRFIERTICYAYWPWDIHSGPRLRSKRVERRAVVVTSAAMPAFLARLFTSGIGLLKKTARVLGARTIGTVLVGHAAIHVRQELPAHAVRKARRLGQRLAAS